MSFQCAANSNVDGRRRARYSNVMKPTFYIALIVGLAACSTESNPDFSNVPITPASEAAPTNTGAPNGLPAGHPSIEQNRGEPIPPANPTNGSEFLTWSAPQTWVPENPSSSMRIAQWRLLGSVEGTWAECALFHFPGGGAVDDNINRWIGQFSQPDGSPSSAVAERSQSVVNGMPLHLVAVTGTFQGAGEPTPNFALIGAVVEGRSMHFLKCTGPTPVVLEHDERIDEFLQSLQPR